MNPEKGFVLRVARKLFPIASDFDGQKFFTRLNGRRATTPFFLVLLLVKPGDLLFACELHNRGVWRHPQAIHRIHLQCLRHLGIAARSTFVLAGAIGRFRYLKTGLSAVLLLIGVKMLLDPHERPPRWYQVDLSPALALASIVAIISVSISASVVMAGAAGEPLPVPPPPCNSIIPS